MNLPPLTKNDKLGRRLACKERSQLLPTITIKRFLSGSPQPHLSLDNLGKSAEDGFLPDEEIAKLAAEQQSSRNPPRQFIGWAVFLESFLQGTPFSARRSAQKDNPNHCDLIFKRLKVEDPIDNRADYRKAINELIAKCEPAKM